MARAASKCSSGSCPNGSNGGKAARDSGSPLRVATEKVLVGQVLAWNHPAGKNLQRRGITDSCNQRWPPAETSKYVWNVGTVAPCGGIPVALGCASQNRPGQNISFAKLINYAITSRHFTLQLPKIIGKIPLDVVDVERHGFIGCTLVSGNEW